MLRDGRWKLRVLELSAVLLLGVLVLSVGDWIEIRRVKVANDAMVSATSSLGKKVDALVVSDQDGTVASLSDIEPGKCRYILVGTRSCPHAKIAADRWLSTALNDPVGVDMPEGWAALWVAADELSGRGALFAPSFPTATFYARDAVALIESAGMTHSPLHLVLDRNGVIVDAGTERRLLPIDAFRNDCTIDTDAAGPSDNNVTSLASPNGT